jgi:hypothetical protein
MKITIELEHEVVEHLIGDLCEAGELKPCGVSEIVMWTVREAVREEIVPIESVRAMVRGD